MIASERACFPNIWGLINLTKDCIDVDCVGGDAFYSSKEIKSNSPSTNFVCLSEQDMTFLSQSLMERNCSLSCEYQYICKSLLVVPVFEKQLPPPCFSLYQIHTKKKSETVKSFNCIREVLYKHDADWSYTVNMEDIESVMEFKQDAFVASMLEYEKKLHLPPDLNLLLVIGTHKQFKKIFDLMNKNIDEYQNIFLNVKLDELGIDENKKMDVFSILINELSKNISFSCSNDIKNKKVVPNNDKTQNIEYIFMIIIVILVVLGIVSILFEWNVLITIIFFIAIALIFLICFLVFVFI